MCNVIRLDQIWIYYLANVHGWQKRPYKITSNIYETKSCRQNVCEYQQIAPWKNSNIFIWFSSLFTLWTYLKQMTSNCNAEPRQIAKAKGSKVTGWNHEHITSYHFLNKIIIHLIELPSSITTFLQIHVMYYISNYIIIPCDLIGK